MDGNCAHPLEVDQGIYDKDSSEYTEKEIEKIMKITIRKGGSKDYDDARAGLGFSKKI